MRERNGKAFQGPFGRQGTLETGVESSGRGEIVANLRPAHPQYFNSCQAGTRISCRAPL